MTRAIDPTITADPCGNVYAAFIADGANFGTGTSDSGLYCCQSTDDGNNWGSPVTVSYDANDRGTPDPNYHFNDRCQMTCDLVSNDSNKGNIYIAWIKDRGWYGWPPPPQVLPWSDIYFSRSTDKGVSFSSSMRINDPNNGMGNMPVPAVAADGTVYVSWLDYNVWTGGQGKIYIKKSTDGGQSFPDWSGSETDHLVATIDLPPLDVNNAGGFPNTKAKGAPVLAASPNDPNELYIVYAADPCTGDPNNDADIYFIKSTDAGGSWNSPVRVNDDSTICDQILPWIAVKPDGTIDIAWYDRRKDILDNLWDVYIVKSTDRGNTFSANTCLTDKSNPAPANNWIGEYLGLAVDANNAYVAFTSSISDVNKGDVYFDKISNAAITALGDFQQDSDVDFYDFAIIANAWKTTPPDPNWDPNCDISNPNDLSIDINDLDVFVGNWLYSY